MSKSRVQAGFTLVELMIVTALIGIVAGIAVPNMMSSRLTANETAVVGAMRALLHGQAQFHSMGVVDLNSDSAPEYGSVGEMSATAVLRGTSERLRPPVLSSSFEVDAQGTVIKSGYYIRLFLPDAGGVGLNETTANMPNVDPAMSNLFWTCLAWPVSRGNSGNTTFFVNQQGQILRSTTATYSGTTVPPAGAALTGVPATRIDSQSLAIGVPGADGNTWVVVR